MEWKSDLGLSPCPAMSVGDLESRDERIAQLPRRRRREIYVSRQVRLLRGPAPGRDDHEDLEGQQAIDFLCYNADDPAERYHAPNTIKIPKNIQSNWRRSPGASI